MSSTHLDKTQRPYGSAYALCFQGTKVALVLRENTNWMNGYWSLPAGKLEEGETFRQAAAREAKEEAGLDVRIEDLTHYLTMHRYVHDEGGITWADLFFHAEKWSGELYNAEPDAHSEAAWFEISDLPENIVPNHKAGIEAFGKGETYLEVDWL